LEQKEDVGKRKREKDETYFEPFDFSIPDVVVPIIRPNTPLLLLLLRVLIELKEEVRNFLHPESM